MITEPTIEVNPKGINPYKIQNHVAMFGISNEPDALPIQRGDRRWQVFETPVTQEQKDLAVANGGFAEIMPKVNGGEGQRRQRLLRGGSVEALTCRHQRLQAR